MAKDSLSDGEDPLERPAAVPPRRISLVISSDAWGGAERHTLVLSETLAARGHRCVIVEINEPRITAHRDLVPEGVEVEVARLGSPLGEPRLNSAYRFLRRLDADVGVFAKGYTKVGTLQFDLACRLAFRGRFITIEHGSPPPRSARTKGRHLGGLVPGLGLWWYKQGLRVHARSLFPSRIVTVSRAVARALIDDYDFPPKKLVPIPNGIDPARFAPDRRARTRVRKAWGVADDAVVFGSVGRLSIPDKGIDISIEQFARLCTAHPHRPLWYVLVGEGRHEERLRRQAAATGWASRILFVGPTEKPWEAHCGIDVYLLPSRMEGIGLSLLEGMACGSCPVAMGVGGVKDVLTDPGMGWMVPPGDRDAFFGGMEAALDLGSTGRATMGARARAHVAEGFRAAEQYGKLADLIEAM